MVKWFLHFIFWFLQISFLILVNINMRVFVEQPLTSKSCCKTTMTDCEYDDNQTLVLLLLAVTVSLVGLRAWSLWSRRCCRLCDLLETSFLFAVLSLSSLAFSAFRFITASFQASFARSALYFLARRGFKLLCHSSRQSVEFFYIKFH